MQTVARRERERERANSDAEVGQQKHQKETAACGARLVARLHCLAVPCLPVPPPNPFASRVGVREGRVAVSMPHMQSAAGSRSYEISNSRRVNCSHAAEENEERIGLGHVR